MEKWIVVWSCLHEGGYHNVAHSLEELKEIVQRVKADPNLIDIDVYRINKILSDEEIEFLFK